MKALIIDDSLFIRRSIQGVLMSSCHFTSVTQKEDGAQGLEEVIRNSRNYDLIILDWNMPVMDGIDVLFGLRNAGIKVPVIMCTTGDDPESIVNAISAGANEYLAKPFQPMELEEKVRAVLEVHNRRSQRSREYRALVVDDSKSIRALERRILLDGDLFSSISEADDGDTALDIVRQQSFDVILVDWEMPRMNGIDVVREIRKSDQTTPIIMVTSHSEKGHIVEAFNTGATNFISKPFTAQTLTSKIKQVLHIE